MQTSPKFDFESFDEQMQEALEQNESAMSRFIIKHSDGLEQPEVDSLFAVDWVEHLKTLGQTEASDTA